MKGRFLAFPDQLGDKGIATVEHFAVESGFSGWTWTVPGREVMFCTVPKRGGTRESHIAQFDVFTKLIEDMDTEHSRDWVISDLVENADYDAEMGE